jgi:glycosyltransferase involved in cell wall biosynthesis
MVVRPFIAGLLPVYVYDDYVGFSVKTFVDLTDEELARYTDLNVAALSAAIHRFDPDVIVTGHEVMGPCIAARATGPSGRAFTAKLHGSALEYAVKKQSRYRNFAIEGLGAAHRVAGGSEYMVREAAAHIPGWVDRAVVVNPGCDTALFHPREVDPHPPTVGYVGKFIAAKGVHDLLAALPLVDVAGLRAVIVGYGGFERELRETAAALQRGDVAAARSAIARDLEHTVEFHAFFESPNDDGYAERARALEIEFPGRLEHGRLSHVLPTFDVLVVPSIVPEAFGMVAAEAAACAVLPVVPDHSGIGEVGAILERALDRPDLLVYDRTDPIPSLAQRVQGLLQLPADERRELGLLACGVAGSKWSWSHVADRLLEVARG